MKHRNRGIAAGRALLAGVALMLGAAVSPTLQAQEEGPLAVPTPAPGAAPKAQRAQGPERDAGRANDPLSQPGGISTAPPSVPVEQIIQKFGERELEFRRERDNFTYEQTFVIQTIDDDGRVDGEYRLGSEIVFTPEGKRYEKITYAPQPSLRRISVSQQDLDDLEHVQPFVLTSEELSKYEVKYVGREQVDEIDAYVFDVGPKKIEKKQRYFQGRIWVDQRDLEIVKTFGKAVPDIRKKNGEENVFPRFETFRENIEGNYWFPTYTRSDDVLHFTGQDVRVRMIVRYRNYKRFASTFKIVSPPKEVKPEKQDKPDKP